MDEKVIEKGPDNVNGDKKTVPVSGKNISVEIWREILLKVRSKNASTEALLRASKPIDFDGRKLSLGVFYKFHKEKLESLPHKACLEDTLRDTIGGEIKVVCLLTEPEPYSRREYTSNLNGVSSSIPVVNSSIGSDVPSVILSDVTDTDIEKLADEVFGS